MSQQNVKVSLIVPVYNGERSLKRCVDSILEQSFSQWELILLDDGSKDSSFYICKEYEQKDARIRVLQKENEGVSATRNRGIKEASGEYIQFVDCDDYLDKNYVGQMVSAMESGQTDLVIAGYTRRKAGEVLENVPTAKTYANKQAFSQDFFELYNHWYLNTPWNKLFRRSCIRSEFPTDRSLGEDLLFNLAYLKEVSNIKVIACCGYQYCIEDANSLGIQFRKDKFENSLYLHEQVLEYVKQDLGLQREEEWQDVTFIKEVGFAITNLIRTEQLEKKDKIAYIKEWCQNKEVQDSYKRCNKLNKKDALIKKLVLAGKAKWIYMLFRILQR